MEIINRDDEKDTIYTIIEVFFRLIKEEDDSIVLIACDASGEMLENGYILSIEDNGKLFLNAAINENIGLQLDEQGRILIDNEF